MDREPPLNPGRFNLIQSRIAELGLDLDALGFPEAWEDADLWSDTYKRNATLAKRVSLLADVDVASNSATRDLLHSRDPKERRSWLNYLKSRRALVWASLGEAKLFPTFQISAEKGDIAPLVGDINSELYDLLISRHNDDEDLRWQIVEWWVVPIEGSDKSPREMFSRDLLTLEIARSAYPR